MQIKSLVNIVTVTDVREEVETYCTVDFADGGATVRYAYADGFVTARICGDTATVERTGEGGYKLTLISGKRTEFTADFMQLSLVTKKLMYKQENDCVKFWAKYAFDGGDDISVTLKTKPCL